MSRRASISRMGLSAASVEATDDWDLRVHVTLPHLQSFRAAARAISFLPHQPARSALQGRHRARIRGRGLDFEELRNYLPGDDVRAIDWKVTARSGAPYVRVYNEERDRPTLIVVDQRMSMFFGTVQNTKSVTAAETAAIVAHRVIDQGDRLGGIVYGDQAVEELRPGRGATALTRFLSVLTQANQRLHADAAKVKPIAMNAVLRAVSRLATRDHLVIVISDFDAADAETERHMGAIAQHNDVVLALVTDPTAESLPEQGAVTGTDGQQQARLDMAAEGVRAGVLSVAADRTDLVTGWQKKMKLSVLPLTTAQDTLPQIVALMGGARR
ncbi:DUF58 domain-containing protein [Shimia sp. MMG029]|uniref:DUF58 domain-containing protein n=1 Tax=Shimia sp. MMG029 TaxID=3021978 RepID=UPI0022FE04E0|nr:DUF58 domain-containing protein [Shimia sp. MMG029]MDA5558442.1 DUF58 domain-containing protein [Shimia sp. MMG029]